MDNIIEINNLSKSFGEVRAVRDISFRVKKGELFAFLGVNGAGKSTTISIMCGQLTKDSGSVTVGGKDIDKDPDGAKESLGVVYQSSVLDAPLTVRDNLESRAALYGIRGREFKERLSELAKLLDFENILGRTLGKLSGGQRRRIDIARALIHRPDILILDEVLSVGDGSFRAKSEKKMKSIISGGATTILVSHSISQVRSMCNKILWLNRGEQVVFGDNVDEICDKYEEFLETKVLPVF